MTITKQTITKHVGATALAVCVAGLFFATSATAENTAAPPVAVTPPAAAAPAKAAPAVKTPAPATAGTAAKVETPKPVWKADDPGKAAAAKTTVAVSPCKGLDQTACGSNKVCAWIVPKDANDKTGKVQEPYCRKVAGVALKKPVVKPTVAKVTAPAATGAPAASGAAATTVPVKPAAKVVAKPAGDAATAPAAGTSAQVVTVKPKPPAVVVTPPAPAQ